jgi:DNA (cytosine-5)-methyltransferase 1
MKLSEVNLSNGSETAESIRLTARTPLSIDLFCGAGGITEGFRRAGFACIFANDIDSDAVKTFRRNHPAAEVVEGPVEEFDPYRVRLGLGVRKGEVDCLVGGPPCQGFSINAPERFLDDTRNALFRNYVDFLKEFEPKTLMFENVPGMLSLANGMLAEQVVREIGALGYSVSAKILFAAHYGVPQERWRLIILGSRKGYPPRHPRPTHYATARANFTGGRNLIFRLSEEDSAELLPYVNVQDAIGDLPRLPAGCGSEEMPYTLGPHSRYSSLMRNGSATVIHHVAPNIAAINLERLRYIQPGGSWRDIPYELLPKGMKQARRSDHTRRYGRLRSEGLAGTVMTKMDPHWGAVFHHEQDRTLTVREAARLQSFPDSYTFYAARVSQYRQVGNAVPVLMAEAVANKLRGVLECW